MQDSYVFDSSTLILLAKITLLKAFAKKNKVIITPKVKAEVLRKKELYDVKIIEHLIEEKLITESKSKFTSKKISMEFNIGEGESEALQLSWEIKSVLATDDWKAIKACKIIDIRFVTAIHCLIYLKNDGELDKKLALEKLKNLEKYGRYNQEIIKYVRKIIEGETHD